MLSTVEAARALSAQLAFLKYIQKLCLVDSAKDADEPSLKPKKSTLDVASMRMREPQYQRCSRWE